MTRKRANASRDGRERTQRQLRVGETLRHALVQVLARGEVRDPDLHDVSVTVTEVRVSPDLKNATAFVMPLGGEGVETVVKALNRAAPFLRRSLAQQVTTRYLPRLGFVVDTAFEHSQHIDEILHSPKVAADLATPGEAPENPPADSD